MSTAAEMLARAAHNPSFFDARGAAPAGRPLLDFCVPVNLHFPRRELLAGLSLRLEELTKYYPDYAEVHQEQLARLTGLPAASIVVANGSTELITELVRSASGPLLTCAPTFGQWTDLPRQHGKVVDYLLRLEEDDFRLDPMRVVEHVRAIRAKTLVLSNPSNPTGVAMPLSDIAWIVDQLADLPLIVIDESFIDFSDVASASRLALERPNLVVVKSLGKSLGLHGIRLGYLVARPSLGEGLRRRMPFWNINGIAAFVLAWVAGHGDVLAESFRLTAVDRAVMADRLGRVRGLRIFPSQANFLFAHLAGPMSGAELRERLLTRHGVFIRDCGNKIGSTSAFLRLAVASPPAVAQLARALEAELGE